MKDQQIERFLKKCLTSQIPNPRPINGTKQSALQKKLNIIKYWEIVDTKIKKENAPLFKNHKPLKIPDPKKGIKFVPHKENSPPNGSWVHLITCPAGLPGSEVKLPHSWLNTFIFFGNHFDFNHPLRPFSSSIFRQ
jgi:hypothetical protein